MLVPGLVFHFVGGKERFWERSWGYVSKIVTQHTAKWGGQNGAMIFQTRSRKGNRNTPISQNSSMQQIELLWKKRLGLLSPPLKQIVSRMKNKSAWQELDDIYYYEIIVAERY